MDYVKQRPLKETTAHLVHMLYKLIQLLYLHVYVTVWEINHWVFHEHTKGNEEAGLISRFNRPHVFTGWWISNFSGFYLRQTIHIRVWIWNKKWKPDIINHHHNLPSTGDGKDIMQITHWPRSISTKTVFKYFTLVYLWKRAIARAGQKALSLIFGKHSGMWYFEPQKSQTSCFLEVEARFRCTYDSG